MKVLLKIDAFTHFDLNYFKMIESANAKANHLTVAIEKTSKDDVRNGDNSDFHSDLERQYMVMNIKQVDSVIINSGLIDNSEYDLILEFRSSPFDRQQL